MNPKVPTRRFGRTGLAMPVFSCGGMRFQQSWEHLGWESVEPSNQANLEAVITRALELGICHIETAHGYGTSELQLGRILPSLPREQIIVQTKIPPKPDRQEFRRLFQESLRRLRLEHVDLLALHGINNRELLEWSLRPGGCLEEALRLRQEGRAQFIGFSTHAPLPVIREAIASGAFDYINLHYYWIFQENLPAIEDAALHDMGVFIISPNDKGGCLYKPSETLRRLCHPLHPMVFNGLFCLQNPAIHTLSLGAARPADFDEHMALVALLPRAAEVVKPISARLEEALEQACGRDWAQHYLDGIPEWDALPGQINLRVILRLWTLDKAFGMRDYAKMRYNLLGQGGHWFPGRNAAGVNEGALLAALPEDYPFKDRIPGILREAHALFAEAPVSRLGRD